MRRALDSGVGPAILGNAGHRGSRTVHPILAGAALVGLPLALGCAEAGPCDTRPLDRSPSPEAGYRSPTLVLEAPEAVFPQDFSYFHTVRELAGGDVLVADPFSQALFRVDMDSGTRTRIGGVGEGPSEYRSPDAVWPLPGDSTLLVDLGNARLTTLDPHLEFVRSEHMVSAHVQGYSPIPVAVDERGMVYVNSWSAWPPGDTLVPILRLDRVTQRLDTVGAYVRPWLRPSRCILASPFLPWGVAPDGTVVVGRQRAYGVNWHAPDGSITHGETVPFEPVPLTDAEKEERFRVAYLHGGASGVVVSARRTRFRESFEELIDAREWPAVLPPIGEETIRVDPEHRAWVRRYAPAGGDATYDLFGGEGRRLASVTLARDRRLAGFGARSVYVAAFGEMDLVRLERYELPVLPP